MHYVSNTEEQKKEMLEAIGVKNVLDLFKDIPKELTLKRKLNIPEALSEIEVKRLLENLAGKNKAGMISFLGAGAYRHFSHTIVNHILLRGEFFTSYTPYQPEDR